MIPRRTILAAAASSLAASHVTSAESTPVPDFPYYEGIARLDVIPNGWGVGINRVILETGQVWHVDYPGPVAVTVDAGVLTIEVDPRIRFTMGDNQGSGGGSESNRGNRIYPRSGIAVDDGILGPLRNDDSETLVIFVTSAVPPFDHDLYESDELHESATPVGP